MQLPSLDLLFYTLAIPSCALGWWGYRDSFKTFSSIATHAKSFFQKELQLPQNYPHISYDGLSMRPLNPPAVEDQQAKKDKQTGFPVRRL